MIKKAIRQIKKHFFNKNSLRFVMPTMLLFLVLAIFYSFYVSAQSGGGAVLGPSLQRGLVGHWTMDEESFVEGTENLVLSITGHGSSLVSTGEFFQGFPIYKNSVTNPNVGNNFGFRQSSNINLDQNGPHFLTLSFWVKMITLPGNMYGYARVYYTDGTNQTHHWSYNPNPFNNSSYIGNWTKVVATISLNTSKTPSYMSHFYVYKDNAVEGEMDIAMVQIEQKSYATSFINGSRQHALLDKTPYNNLSLIYGASFTNNRLNSLGKATNFNGGNSYAVVENTNSFFNFTAGQPFSYGAWFKATSFPASWHGIISKMPTWGNGYNLQVGLSQNIACGIGVYVKTNWIPQINTWYHAMCVYDGAVMRLYVNGVQESSATRAIISGDTDLKLGMFYSTGSLPFFGAIDDVRIYNRALSQEEINLLYNSYKPKMMIKSDAPKITPNLQKGLILDMPLTSNYTKGGAAGSEIMTDRTPYSNDGQNYGAVITNQGGNFNGTTNYINAGNSSIFDLATAGSVSVWLKIPTTWSGNVYPNLVSKGASAGWDTNGWSLYAFSTNAIGIGMRNGTLTLSRSFSNSIKDEWMHIVGTWNGSTVSVYQNGILKTSTSQTITPGLNASNVIISRGPTAHYFGGNISNVRVYNRAITPEEVSLLYSRGRH